VRDILGVWSQVFAPSRPGLGVFGSGLGIWVGRTAMQGTAGKGQHDGVGASWHGLFARFGLAFVSVFL